MVAAAVQSELRFFLCGCRLPPSTPWLNFNAGDLGWPRAAAAYIVLGLAARQCWQCHRQEVVWHVLEE